MASRPSVGLLIIDVLLLSILFFGLTKIIIRGDQYFLQLELIGIVLLLAVGIVGLVAYHTWGRTIIFLVFLLYIANLVTIWVVYGTLYIILLVLALLGFLIHIMIPLHPLPQQKESNEEPHSLVFDNPSQKGVFASINASNHKTEAKETPSKVKAVYSPGKYVASNKSNQIHQPKCDWAKKIAKSRQVWFASKEEAWEKGYRSHSCMTEK